MKRLSLMLLAVAVATVAAMAAEKLTGANGMKFGWKLDRCKEVLADPERGHDVTDGDEGKYYYSPAKWGGYDWANGVLDFYRGKLYQIGYSDTSSTDDRTHFDGARSHLSALYGDPAVIKDNPDNLLWRAKNGNIAVLQYVRERVNDNYSYSTYVYLIDNKEVVKKAKAAESELRDIMGRR